MILLVAATEAELCALPGLVCGVGPVEAAAATARAIALERPGAVLHVGVAGGVGLDPGTLVVGTGSTYADLEAAIPVVSRAEPDPALLAAARAALPDALCCPVVTSAAVSDKPVTVTSGDSHRLEATVTSGDCGLVEAMEGFAVLRACALAGVPAVEVRAIANELGEEDRSRWDLPRALAALDDAIPRLLAALAK